MEPLGRAEWGRKARVPVSTLVSSPAPLSTGTCPVLTRGPLCSARSVTTHHPLFKNFTYLTNASLVPTVFSNGRISRIVCVSIRFSFPRRKTFLKGCSKLKRSVDLGEYPSAESRCPGADLLSPRGQLGCTRAWWQKHCW